MTHGQDTTRGRPIPPRPRAETPDLRLTTVSTVEAAANALRELILDGRLEPGRAAARGRVRGAARDRPALVSRRDADPVAEGLLHREPNRGVRVPVFDPDDLIDVFRLRAALEVEAVRLLIASGEIPAATREPVEELSALARRRPLARRGRAGHALSPRDHRRLGIGAAGARLLDACSRRSSSASSSSVPTTSARRRSPPSTRS